MTELSVSSCPSCPSSSSAVVTTPSFTPWPQVQTFHSTLYHTFASGKTKSLKWRKWQLKQLWWLMTDNESAIISALQHDLRRHEIEAISSDIMTVKRDILDVLKTLESYAKDEPVKEAGPIFRYIARAHVRKEPLGVSLIIGAWNFPFLLSLQPLTAAVSAGCCVMLKPSELTTACNNLLTSLVNRYMDPEAIRAVTGAAAETQKILELSFNQIFFTGSTRIAKFVMAAATKHLTPVVLELGGQDPAVVTESANVDLAAKRLAFSKFLNSGQICLSANHVFVNPKVHDEFVDRLTFWTREFSTADGGHMCKIVNERNFERLSGFLSQTQGHVIMIEAPEENFLFPPVIVTGVSVNDSIMSEELFGPICPVIKATTAEALHYINASPRPLALYIFSQDKAEVSHIMSNTISGGVTVNDTIMHYAVPTAPFGGVGDSGQGYYHGRHGFLAFSHQRTVTSIPNWMEPLLKGRYPPYSVGNKAKLTVKNELGFRRGEGLEDQVEKETVWRKLKGWWRSGSDDRPPVGEVLINEEERNTEVEIVPRGVRRVLGGFRTRKSKSQ